MLNKAIVQGRIVNDIIVNDLDPETKITTFTLACERDFINKATGKRDVDFIDITAKGKLSEFVERNFSKGEVVIATGRLRRKDYVDSNGNSRTALSITCESVYR